MTGGTQPYVQIAREDRRRTMQAYDDLVAAAEHAIGQGFHPRNDLHEIIAAPARELGVFVWPTLGRRIVAEARWSTPSP